MARTEAYTEEQVINATRNSGGFVTEIAKRLGCSRATVYAYKKRYPKIAEAIFEEKEGLLDAAEGQLLKQIKNGNITAIIFYLKTQGYKRAYGDRTKLDIDGKFITKEKRKADKKEDAAYVQSVLEEMESLKLAPSEGEATD